VSLTHHLRKGENPKSRAENRKKRKREVQANKKGQQFSTRPSGLSAREKRGDTPPGRKKSPQTQRNTSRQFHHPNQNCRRKRKGAINRWKKREGGGNHLLTEKGEKKRRGGQFGATGETSAI